VAIAVFAAEGLSVPIHEIARRAGVGTGTVSRHFPTKESLYEAIVHDRTERLVQQARALMAEEPGKAFFDFFSIMVNEFAINAGLADALAGAGFDVEAAASSSEHDVIGALRELLTRAQKAGAVRKDVDVADVKSLILACCTRSRHSTDGRARRRMVEVVCQGLRPT
jgi:AcrR family transcriptional regulator